MRNDSDVMVERKAKSFAKLSERYYGKLDLQTEWDSFPGVDDAYRVDLARRVRILKNDLTYRGADIE
jgi:hypothetical protein